MTTCLLRYVFDLNTRISFYKWYDRTSYYTYTILYTLLQPVTACILTWEKKIDNKTYKALNDIFWHNVFMMYLGRCYITIRNSKKMFLAFGFIFAIVWYDFFNVRCVKIFSHITWHIMQIIIRILTICVWWEYVQLFQNYYSIIFP